MSPRVAAALALALTLGPAAARAADTTTEVADGVTLLTRTTATPNAIRRLKIDLDTPGVRFGATTSAQRRRTTSSYAKLVDAAAAINGDFFSYATYGTTGLAAGGGARWTDTRDDSTSANLAFDDGRRLELYDRSRVVAFDPAWMKGVVSGHPQLVNAGVALTTNPGSAACTTRNPRSAVGLSQDKKTLYLVVVDGRSSTSAGMTCTELAATLKGFGAHDAFNLDGGGSTTLYLRGRGVVNRPSDGSERVVANHLAVFAPRLGTVGSVKGLVFAEPDRAKPLDKAQVSITGGGADTTDARGGYELETLPGTLTVTAKRAGYTTKTARVTVAAGADAKLDFGLVPDPNADFDEDGVRDGVDNCDEVKNPDQRDSDGDKLGDACDKDDDGDGVADEDDNCPGAKNPDQADSDDDGVGDACAGGRDAGPDGATPSSPASPPGPVAPGADAPPAGDPGCAVSRATSGSTALALALGALALAATRRRARR